MVALGRPRMFAPATAYGKNILPRVAAKPTQHRFPRSAGRSADTFTPDLRRQRDRYSAVERQDQVITARPTNSTLQRPREDRRLSKRPAVAAVTVRVCRPRHR
jgi:hypothetical protein